MIVSNAFKNDILSKNTQLIPVVIIEKLRYEMSTCVLSILPYITQQTTEEGCQALGGAWEGGEDQNPYKRILLSTHNIQIEDNYFNPLLLDVPRISHKIDLIDAKFQTSSLTLRLSNTDYNNSKRISEELESYDLLNAVVCIHYKSQSCTKIQLPEQDEDGVLIENTDTDVGCPRVFSGVIRDIKHQKDNITLTVEDMTDKRLDRDLPTDRVSSSHNVIDKYKNAYYPMLFGKVENAPTVASYEGGRLTFRADSYPINRIYYDEVGYGIPWTYNSIKIYHDGYLPITKYVHDKFDTKYRLSSNNAKQYVLTSDNAISFDTKSMLNVIDSVEIIYHGAPKTIVLNNGYGDIIIADSNCDNGLFDWYGAEEYQNITDANYDVITDGSMQSLNTQNIPINFRLTNQGGGLLSCINYLAGLLSLQWDAGITGQTHTRVLRNSINGIHIPTMGGGRQLSDVPMDYNEYEYMYVTDHVGFFGAFASMYLDSDWAFDFDIDEDVVQQSFIAQFPSQVNMTDLISFGNDNNTINWISGNIPPSYLSTTYSYNPDADIKITKSVTLGVTVESDGTGGEGVPYNTPDFWPIIRLGSGTNSLPQTGSGWSSFEIMAHIYSDGTQNNSLPLGFYAPVGGDFTFSSNLQLKEIDLTALALYDRAIDKNFYLNAEGRTDDYLLNYEHTWGDYGYEIPINNPDILENPVDIIRHIMVESCGFTQDDFDEDEFNLAWSLRQIQGEPFVTSPMKLAFSINKEINAKEVLQTISKNCMVYPNFKNNGKIGFTAIQKTYLPELDPDYGYVYNSAKKIDINDIIKYTFSLTSSSDLVSKVDVSYNYDYENKKNTKTTSSKEMEPEELDWYGITDVEDSYLNYEAKYINDEQSAETLRDLIFYDRKSRHLQIELVLPLSYIDSEIGDLYRFPENKLIDGIKAHGINYSIPDNYGGVVRIPLFQVIDITKNLNNIKIKLHQLHGLGTQQTESSWFAGVSEFYDEDYMIDPLWNAVWKFGPTLGETISDEPDEEVVDWPESFFVDAGFGQFGSTWQNAIHMDSVRFFVGTDSEFSTSGVNIDGEIQGVDFNSFNKRWFIISDESMMEEGEGTFGGGVINLGGEVTDHFNNLFGHINFIENGETEWTNLNNSPDDDDWNPITVRMFGHPEWPVQHFEYFLRYQNINQTILDEDMYDSHEEYISAIIPTQLEEPDGSIKKMQWVAYKSDGITLNHYGQPIGDYTNLEILFATWGNENYSGSSSFNHYVFEMEINPYQMEGVGDNLWYNTNREGYLFYPAFVNTGEDDSGGDDSGEDDSGGEVVVGGSGDVNLDNMRDILDITALINILINPNVDFEDYGGQASEDAADVNADSQVNLLDVIMLINMIMEQGPYSEGT